MSSTDLQRLLQRATPRIEDVRSPDRTDIIRREHGHLTLREIVDAIDALEFSADTFVEVFGSMPESKEEEKPTAVHGAFRALSGVKFLSPELQEPSAPASSSSSTEEADGEGNEEAALAAKTSGAGFFKEKDFVKAEAAYTEVIKNLPKGHADLAAAYSNRCAARLQCDRALEALSDARRCVELKPEWPKAHFRAGTALRQLGFYCEACAAFRAGKALEPDNKDWDKELEKTSLQRSTFKPALARQLMLWLLPEFLWAWARGKDETGVLQVQLNADLKELGRPKWRAVREGEKMPTATTRYAFCSRKDYLSNLTGVMQKPVKEVGIVDISGKSLKIAEISSFFQENPNCAYLHLDVRCGSPDKLVAILVAVPCDAMVQSFFASKKEPEAPKGTVENVLALQKTSGFPLAYPRLIGFQALPGGDLNFPVIDIQRDAPQLA